MTHTPTPWAFDGNCGGYIWQDDARIARAYSNSDAAFIVEAVNGYQKAVEALRRIESLCEAPPGYHSDFVRGQILEVAQAALAIPTDTGSVT